MRLKKLRGGIGMSRSYKKNPWVTDHTRKTTKEKKRQANKSFRNQIERDEDMPARPKHKKYTESWEISDYKWRLSKEHFLKLWEEDEFVHERFPTKEVALRWWYKWYRNK